jgi:transposase
MADQGDDSEAWLAAVTAAGVQVVIPPRANRTQQREYDQYLYRERPLSECFINKCTHYRHVFSRFEQLSKTFLGFLSVVSALIWLR